MYDIIIVGAGAAGLAAATEAVLLKPDINILILEKGNKCGRKLSASGNGKCNLTNAYFVSDCYFSNNTTFVNEFIADDPPSEIISFFERCGILVYEKNGYYYPVSDMAKQVTAKLIKICVNHGVLVEYDKCVIDIDVFEDGERYVVKTTDSEYESHKIIIATGSSSYPGLGGSEAGYELVNRLNIGIIPVYPVLIPIYVDDEKLSIAQGVRINAVITLHIDDETVRERGQVQINNNNLSGIAIMNISCYLPKIKEDVAKECMYVDYLPDMSWDKLKSFIKQQCSNNICDTILTVLEGIFPTGFAKYILSKVNIDPGTYSNIISEKQINRIASNIKKMRYTPKVKFDNNKSQASIGGVDLNEINSDTFESKKYKGLFIVGEALDITGKCGGYNLTFAFLSGIKAAVHAVEHL